LEFLTLKSFLTYLPLKQRGANRPPPIGKRVNNKTHTQHTYPQCDRHPCGGFPPLNDLNSDLPITKKSQVSTTPAGDHQSGKFYRYYKMNNNG
jgi:hypothetical protein